MRQSLLRLIRRLPKFARSMSSLPRAVSSIDQAVSLIRSEPSQYVVAAFLGRRYILSPRDILVVPRIHDVSVGDVVELDAIHEVGSRQYTLRGGPALPQDILRVHAVVMEHTKGALQKIEKFKRRKGYRRLLDHKQPFTRLRIGPIELGPE